MDGRPLVRLGKAFSSPVEITSNGRKSETKMVRVNGTIRRFDASPQRAVKSDLGDVNQYYLRPCIIIYGRGNPSRDGQLKGLLCSRKRVITTRLRVSGVFFLPRLRTSLLLRSPSDDEMQRIGNSLGPSYASFCLLMPYVSCAVNTRSWRRSIESWLLLIKSARDKILRLISRRKL